MDVTTGLLIFASLMAVVGGVLKLISWSTMPFEGPGQWGNGLLLFAVGLFLFLGRGELPDFLSMFVANCVIFLGVLVVYRGVNAFLGLEDRFVPQALAITAYVLLIFVFALVIESQNLRVLVNAVFFGTTAYLTGYRLMVHRKAETRVSQTAVAVLLFVVAVAFGIGGGMAAQAVFTGGALASSEPGVSQGPAFAFLLVALPAVNVGWGLGLIFMAMQRVVAGLNEANRRMSLEVEERRKAEQNRTDAEDRFRDFAESASDWYWEMDRDLRITYVSDAVFRHNGGVPPSEFLGKTRRELAGLEAEDEHWVAHLEDLEAHRPFREFEYDFLDHEGKRHHWAISGRPVFDEVGHFQGYRGVGHDVSERKQVEAALRQSEQKFATAFHKSPLLIAINDLETGRYIEVNDTYLEFSGYSRDEIIGRTSVELGFVSGEFREKFKQSVLDEGRVFGMEVPVRIKDGTERIVRIFSEVIDYGGEKSLLGLLEDITESQAALQALEKSEARLADAIESISDGFVLWDKNDELVMCNARYHDFYRDAEDLIAPGVSFEQNLRNSLGRGAFTVEGDQEAWIRERVKLHRLASSEFEATVRGGRWLHIKERPTSEGGIVGVYTDITHVKQAEEDIHFRANFDPLTGLPNRASFIEYLDQAVARSRRTRRLVALMFVDLDRFKNVNDTLGHAIGDELLKQAGARIKASVRATDTVSRLGGDEFTVILNDLVGDMDATIVAESMIAQLTKSYDVEGHEVYAGASVGITICPNDGTDRDTLLKNADMAMYQAKEMGGNTFRFFTRRMTEKAQRFVEVEKDLRRALDSREFIIHYQPVVDLANDAIIGAEALVRWEHPQRGLVPPDQFVPVAEETGLIVGLGEWVLRTAIEGAVKWPAGTDSVGPYLAVNVSSRQFKGSFGREVVEGILAETGFPAHRLMFEITESLLMDEDDRIAQAMEDFRDLGVILAIEDFGTGYSSLSYLRRFPVSVLKIDREFIRDMDVDPNDARLVQTIIAMAKGLKMTLVAEGVEKTEQVELLRRLGCDRAQGYLYGRPVDEVGFSIAAGQLVQAE